MIDIHSHIIPSIDDGCSDINESISLIKDAANSNVDKIIATPHFKDGVYVKEKYDVINYCKSVNSVLRLNNINVTVYPGHEIMIDSNTFSLIKEDKLCSLNNSRYFLIEFNMFVKPFNIIETLKNIISLGYVVIIAHPERYNYMDVKFAKELKSIGCLLQMEISSILGSFGNDAKKRVVKLLKNDCISLWGSDTHSFRNTYPEINDAILKLKKVIKKDKFLDIICNNNSKVFNNEEIID